MPAVVKTILPDSPADNTIIKPKDILLTINGNEINDILDYKFFSYDSKLSLEFVDENDEYKYVTLNKSEGENPGIEFESALLDTQHFCENNCIFCFIDQLPQGMRESLYYKDDDLRLSFMQGNYITLTNLSGRDINRIIKMRISPINVSVHTLEPRLRCNMLRNKKAANAIGHFFKLAEAGIILNCQIVCCPGINDGLMLNRTLKKLFRLGPAINSVSIVPVGLTKHRDRLVPLTPFDRELALDTIHQVERVARMCYVERGERVFYCSDELYALAGLKLPSNNFYEDYPQLENGVGMMRLFITEFLDEAKKSRYHNKYMEPFSIATGELAAPYIIKLIKFYNKTYSQIPATVYVVKNDFLGRSITVSGLITGNDILSQLKGKNLGSKLFIPKNMLRSGENVFLDNMSVSDLSSALSIPVKVVDTNGAEFLRAIFE